MSPEPSPGLTAADLEQHPVALPTGRFVAVAWGAAGLTGAGWAGAIFAVGADADLAWAGLAAAGVVAASATLALLIIQPWRKRSLLRWPMLWVAGSFLRMVITLGGCILLYSATPYRGVSLWLAMAASYVAVMFGETRVYASAMKRLAPPGPAGGTRTPNSPE